MKNFEPILWIAIGLLGAYGVLYLFSLFIKANINHHTRRELLEREHNHASYIEQRQEIEKLYSIWNLVPGTPEYRNGWRELKELKDMNEKAWSARVAKIVNTND